MFCSHCGVFIGSEYARFCPNCGHGLDGRGVPPSAQRDGSSGGHAKKAGPSTVAAITVCIVLVLVFGLFIGVFGLIDEGKPEKKEILPLTEDSYFEVSGDFLTEREIFTVGLTDDGISFTLNAELSLNYDNYSWWLFDHDLPSSTSTTVYSGYTGSALDKTEPVLYYLTQKPGEYSVSVDCYAESGGKPVHSAYYSGKVVYVKMITREYNWTYDGTDHTAEVTFSYDDYLHYKYMNTRGRAPSSFNYDKITSFITYDDPVVTDLAGSLLKAYGSGRDTSDQAFASFILAFVQICYDYPPQPLRFGWTAVGADMYQYWQEEYFAYPLETIFYSMGDCEDTSILAAALFKALGYDAGVLIVPGHALAAVGLDVYDEGSYDPLSFEIISQTIDDVTYFACETTVDDFQSIGLISSTGSDGLPYSSYIGRSGYGFYVL